ncbi:AAA family ATPase [Burkholderia multivorans]|uniref:AAA family ATPase n=1 Tax=Burkholderia multivorans TaxID=87883 RepID=UPI001902DCF8|nr:AAA family ATPase [Burkholderia multivorans]MBJ9624567.1 AAA family ATPase [Burkholderia multivorans]
MNVDDGPDWLAADTLQAYEEQAMGMLKPAKNKMAYAKVGLYGSAGSGKTRTASEIAIGLHKAIGSTKPIAAFDTEPAFSFVLPLFEHAGIELLVADESRALSDLMDFMDEAEKTCDIAIIDSITHVWRDAQESYLRRMNETRKKYGKKPLGALEFQHWRPIKAAWAEFTDRFLSSKMHVIVCGRAGQVYEYQDKDDGSGKKELISTGTRMATEKELGYEPSLLIEMIADRRDGYIVNTAVIQKDRADRLNGREIEKPDYAKLEGHFQALNIGGQHFDSMDRRDSQNMFPDADESGWDAEKRNREIWCEEIAELLKKYYPSQTADDKKSRQDLIEQFFDTRSWTRVEGMKADLLKQAYEDMRVHLEEKFSNSPSQPAEGSDTPPEQEAA